METVTFELNYAKSKFVIAGEPDAMCWLRNVVMDAAKFHENEGRIATAESIKDFWNAMYEAKEKAEETR